MTDADLIREAREWPHNASHEASKAFITRLADALEQRGRDVDEARGVANANANSANRERIKLLNKVAAAERERDNLREVFERDTHRYLELTRERDALLAATISDDSIRNIASAYSVIPTSNVRQFVRDCVRAAIDAAKGPT